MAFIITIPAEVSLGADFNITANADRVLGSKTVQVKYNSDHTMTLEDTNATLTYGTYNASSELIANDSVAASFTEDSADSVTLHTNCEGNPAYAGTYTGTISFTVQVVD